jgi:hypothetical protein
MLYGLSFLLAAGICYVAHIFLVRRYSNDQASRPSTIRAKSCMVPKQVRFLGALSLLLSFVGFVVLLVASIKV